VSVFINCVIYVFLCYLVIRYKLCRLYNNELEARMIYKMNCEG